MNNHTYINLESSKIEYESLSENEWIKIYFNDKNGGYLATHKLKVKDDPSIPGIVAEAQACLELASIGEHVLRLPENIPELIDTIVIDKKPYHELLKFKPGESNPRGYPDAYFNGQTWDFKTSTFKNEITLRHRIKRNDKRQITLPSRGAIKTLSGSYYIANIQQFLYSAIFLLIFLSLSNYLSSSIAFKRVISSL